MNSADSGIVKLNYKYYPATVQFDLTHKLNKKSRFFQNSIDSKKGGIILYNYGRAN